MLIGLETRMEALSLEASQRSQVNHTRLKSGNRDCHPADVDYTHRQVIQQY